MKSIIHENKQCFLCNSNFRLEDHHIFGGTANRKISEKYGLKVWLCGYCHQGVTTCNQDYYRLKAVAQERFEELYSHEEFMAVIKKNYIGG